MGWMQSLCNAYDSVVNARFSDGEAPLIPVGFTQKEVKFHVVLNRAGEFRTAEVWDDKKQKHYEMVPSTPQAESRTGENGTPYPLSDQLKYFVCEDDESICFRKYMNQLSAWCAEENAPDCLRVLKTYLERKTILQDLTEKAHIAVKYHKDPDKHDGKGPDAKAFVVFSVDSGADEEESALWRRRDVKESWNRHIASHSSLEQKLCYIEGEKRPIVDNHPKVQGNAKLISAKDAEYPFQYKGRFTEDRSAAAVSYSASMCAHNALDWLVARQGFSRYGMTWVVWGSGGMELKAPVDDAENMEWVFDDETEAKPPQTLKEYARAIRTAHLGWKNGIDTYKLDEHTQVSVLGMEAATKGRMSIVYYQELPGNTYVQNIKGWYESCSWGRIVWTDVTDADKKKLRRVASVQPFTPNPLSIARAVMGTDAVQTARADAKCAKSPTKLLREINCRLMACITNQALLPHQMVESAFQRAISPLSFSDGEGRWSRRRWMECVEAACALIHKEQRQHETRYLSEGTEKCAPVFDVALDRSSTHRDYLYGRLLAVAHYGEFCAGGYQNELTNAVQLFRQYVQRPFDLWPHVHNKLLPYLAELWEKGKCTWVQRQLQEIERSFLPEDILDKSGLGTIFLQGFHSQYLTMCCHHEKLSAKETQTERNAYQLPHSRSEKFGCLLAVGDFVEQKAIEGKNAEGQIIYDHAGTTTAQRMMLVFAQRPAETWEYIHGRLIPYLERLEKAAACDDDLNRAGCQGIKISHPERKYANLLSWVEGAFLPEERSNNEKLDRTFLNSFYRMKSALFGGLSAPKQSVCSDRPCSREEAYGQLLGMENQIERFVMDHIQKLPPAQYRLSNALRFMPNFSKRPAESWDRLKRKLECYQKHLPASRRVWLDQLACLEKQMNEWGWDTNEPLQPEFLTYYYRNC